jgi:cytochrome c
MRFTPVLLFANVIMFAAVLFFVKCAHREKKKSANVSLTYTSNSEDTVSIKQGALLFVKNCGACHNIEATDSHFDGIVERLGEDYFNIYITKQDSLIKAKNKHAVELKRLFRNQTNSHNFKFSSEELNAIIGYLRKYLSW